MAGMTEMAMQEFLAEPHIGVIGVVSDDGRPPLTVPLSYAYEPGGNLTFFTGTMGRRARKKRFIAQSGHISLCVQKEEFPYKYVTVEGTVIDTAEPPAEPEMLKIVRRYLPEEAARGMVRHELSIPDSELILYTVRPDRWSSMDFSESAEEAA
ncbi:MAG: pyridoxamine 5'-phosphate oxidase family protein [Chloroflexota bacterium]